MFFFEKKNQKTFGHVACRPGQRVRKLAKVFCFFFSKKKSFLPLGFLGYLLASAAANAADIHVVVTHVRNARGHVLVALCARADFLKPHCPWQGMAPAALGSVQVVMHGVPAGRYAVEAFHDENDNQILDRNFLGFPVEGLTFSRDAPMHFGPPAFDAAALDVTGSNMETKLTMRYY